MNSFKSTIRTNSADVGMSVIILIWGFHFIVMKNGMATIEPMTYNALRFAVPLPILFAVAFRYPALWHVSWRDLGLIALLTLIGPFGYQIGFAQGLEMTTSTNAALLTATSPAWTALISVAVGIVAIRRRLVVGIVITLLGVALVILGRAGAELAFSHDDLVGSGLLLAATIIGAVGNIGIKPIIDRLGGMRIAIWTYWLTTAGLVILAAPDLVYLSADDVPLRMWPNIFYSGVLSSLLGFLVWNYALGILGPTRASTYNNFTPIIAAFGGIAVLGETVSPGLLVGGAFTLIGVLVVRNNTYLRQSVSDHSGTA